MAEEKKKTTIKKKVETKKETSAKAIDKIEEETVEETKEGKTGVDSLISKKIEEVPSKKKIRKIDREEWIPVMNYTTGGFGFQHPSCRTELRMEKYGDMDYIQYGDLLTMKASQGRILREPWLLVLDEDVYISLGFEKLYEKVITMEDVERLYGLSPKEIEDILKKAPRIVRENVCRRILELKKQGKWDSLSKLQAVEKAVGINFKEIDNTAQKYQK